MRGLLISAATGSELDGRLAKARRHFLPTRQRTGGRRPTSTLPFLSCLLGSEQPTASSQSATDFLLPTRQRTNMLLLLRQPFCCLLGSEPGGCPAIARRILLPTGSELAQCGITGELFCCPGSEPPRRPARKPHVLLPTRQRTVPKSTQPFDSKENNAPRIKHPNSRPIYKPLIPLTFNRPSKRVRCGHPSLGITPAQSSPPPALRASDSATVRFATFFN